MTNNKWMFLCLLLGSILMVGLVSSMPLYTEGILQRMLDRDLQDYQTATSSFPGEFTVTNKYFPEQDDVDGVKAFNEFDKMIEKSLVPDYKLPLLSSSKELSIRDLDLNPEELTGSNKTHPFVLKTINNLEKHITITQGGIYKNKRENDTFDVVMTEGAAKKFDLLAGQVLQVSRYSPDKKFTKIFKIRVSGIFTAKDAGDRFWSASFLIFR